MIRCPTLSFERKALAIYQYQYRLNPLYKQFINLVRYNGFQPNNVSDIPCLPITLFKTNIIKTAEWETNTVFLSSGTTGTIRSQHYIRDLNWYIEVATNIWTGHFNSLDQIVFLSLLPNYHENPSSSLLYMVEHFMKNSSDGQTSYYLHNYPDLNRRLKQLMNDRMDTVLFGVSFALMDYLTNYQHHEAGHLTVIETGGMKKFRKELTRQSLHMHLAEGFRKANVLSEYGMTECLSQMYCLDGRRFEPNDFMRIYITDPSDPPVQMPTGTRGRINIIDLANFDTISFISTDDLGDSDEAGRIDIIGRLDNCDLRGCNYLI